MSRPKARRSAAIGLSVLLAITLLVGVAACAGTAPTATVTAVPQNQAPKEQPKQQSKEEPTPQPKEQAKEAQKPQSSPTPVPRTGSQTLDPVRIGVLSTSIGNAGIYIAVDRGYFKEQGIQPQEVPFGSGPEMMPMVATGQLEVGASGPGVSLFNALARDVNVRIVADKGSSAPGMGWISLVIRKDLYDSGVKTVKDLRGKKVAIQTITGTQVVAMRKYILPQAGLTENDIQLVELQFTDQLGALKNKAVDAAYTNEPYAAIMQQQGLGKLVLTTDQAYPYQQNSVLLYSPQFAEQTDVARRFMVAYLKGIRDYNDAFVKHKDREAMVDLLAKRKVITDLNLLDMMQITGLNPNGGVFTDSIKGDQEDLFQHDQIKTKVDVDQFVDNSFAEYATKVLGEYK